LETVRTLQRNNKLEGATKKMNRPKVTILDIQKAKEDQRKLVMMTAYDYPFGLMADEAGVDIVLVGDSLGMVVMGLQGTVAVTMEHMIHHIQAVMRGCKSALVVGDMPFMSYNTSIREAIANAGRLMKEGGCDVVKLEGGVAFAPTVEAIVKAGIPVQGHIGLTPQTASALGGFKMQGKDAAAAKQIIDDARALEAAGAFSIILEAVPAPWATGGPVGQGPGHRDRRGSGRGRPGARHPRHGRALRQVRAQVREAVHADPPDHSGRAEGLQTGSAGSEVSGPRALLQDAR
jgi:3-methyl-2-oxobutanoate hydroxymethyltransferase